MLLSGDIDDNDTVYIAAGSDGLIVGDRIGTSGVSPPDDVVVH
jgi:ATP-dependent Clp protease ATP-binding subunit ClpB